MLLDEADGCDVALPVRRDADRYTFATFFELTTDKGAPLVIPRARLLSARQLAALTPRARSELDAERGPGGLSPPSKGVAPQSVAPRQRTARPRLSRLQHRIRLDELIESPVVRAGGARVRLGERDVQELLDGRGVAVNIDGATHNLVPTVGRLPRSLRKLLGRLPVPTQAVVMPSGELPDTVECVLYVPYVQRWKLLGYCRGELLNSIPLTPQEEARIEVYTWDRRQREAEEAGATELERDYDVAFTSKDSLDVMREIAAGQERILSGKAEITAGIPDKVSVGASGSQQTTSNLKDAAEAKQARVIDMTVRATSRLKSSRSTKVRETQEWGSETKVTRTLKNHNFVRPLAFQYFQDLAGFSVKTRLDRQGIRLGVKVANLLPGPIDRYFVVHHEASLRDALRSSRYDSGFDAVRRLAALDRTRELSCAGDCDCPASIDERIGRRPGAIDVKALKLRVTNTAWQDFRARFGSFIDVLDQEARAALEAKTKDDAWRATERGLRAVGLEFDTGQERDRILQPIYALKRAVDDLRSASNYPLSSKLRTGNAITQKDIDDFQKVLYRTLALADAAPEFWAGLVDWADAASANRDLPLLNQLRSVLCQPRRQVVSAISLPNSRLSQYAALMGALAENWGSDHSRFAGFRDAGFEGALAGARGAIASIIAGGGARVAPTGLSPLPAATSLPGTPGPGGIEDYAEAAAMITAPSIYVPAKVAYEGAKAIVGGVKAVAGLFGLGDDEDEDDEPSSDSGPARLQAEAERLRARRAIEAAELQAELAKQAADASKASEQQAYAKETSEALVAETQLLAHLNLNASYYRQAVWSDLSYDDRLNLLRSRGDRLVDKVENEVLGYIGDKAVMPLRMSAFAEAKIWMEQNVLTNSAIQPDPGARTVEVPTRAITVQTRLGRCDTTERFVMDHRELDVELKRAEVEAARHRAAQEEQEARRYALRLDRSKPRLADPTSDGGAGPLRIIVERDD